MTEPSLSPILAAPPIGGGRAAGSPPSSRTLAYVCLGLLAALSAGLSLALVGTEIWLDDPFIGFRYAANLERGLGLAYNAGEAVEGYTAWLWVMFAWVAALLDVDPLVFSQWINVASQMGAVWLAFHFGDRPGRSPLRALVAPALVATHLANVTWSMMGLESNFLMVLATGAALLQARVREPSTRQSLLLGTLLLLVALVRFDGLILAGVVMAYAVLCDREVKRSLPATAVLAVGLAAFNLWRFAYYGQPFPNTFYAKQSTFQDEVDFGTRYVVDFFRRGGPYVLAFAGLPSLAWSLDRRLTVAAWAAAGHLGYVAIIGGDWMVDYRFILPVLPLLAFMLQECLWGAVDGLRSGRVRRVLAPAALAALLLWNLHPLHASGWTGWRREKRPDAYWNAGEARRIGQHLDRALPPDVLVATEWAGIIPYCMRQPVFDIFGLNDADIMRQDFPGSRMGRKITHEYLMGRAPDVVIVVAVLFETPEAARAGIDLRPEGTWIASFYAALQEPAYGYEVAVTKVAEGAYYPFLIKADVAWRASVDVGAPR